MLGDRHRRAFDVGDAADGIAREGVATLSVARRPAVAVVFEPAIEVVFLALDRQGKEFSGRVAHGDEQALLADENIRPRHPRRDEKPENNEGGAEKPDARLPKRKPDPAREHQHERERGDFRNMAHGARQRADFVRAPCHAFDAPAHRLQADPFEPNGIRTMASSAAGMTTMLQIGMAIMLASTAYCWL